MRHAANMVWLFCSLVLRSQVIDSKHICILPSTADPAGDAASDAVVHLVIQRPAKVGWQVAHDNNFELSITRHDTADTLKQKLEHKHGLLADSHRLLYNGKVVPCTKPLLQFGIDKGSVLELAPFEPTPSSTPGTSPMLSSPEHELFEGWQKARAGLAKGYAPKLATAGTGGQLAVKHDIYRCIHIQSADVQCSISSLAVHCIYRPGDQTHVNPLCMETLFSSLQHTECLPS